MPGPSLVYSLYTSLGLGDMISYQDHDKYCHDTLLRDIEGMVIFSTG